MPRDIFTVAADFIDDFLSTFVNQYASALNNIERATPFAAYMIRITMSGNITLTDASDPVQSLDCNGSNRVVTLPAAATTNGAFYISNRSSGRYTITVNDNSSTTIAVIYPGSVYIFVSDAFGWNVERPGMPKVVHIFNGTTGYTPSLGVYAIYVECVAGGGAGGGAAVSSSNLSLGGGGGAGGYSAKMITGPLKASYTVAVGAGGTGVSGTTGNNGGDTTFDSPSVCTAKGGTGGGTLAAGTSATTQPGGGGAVGSSGTGDIKFDASDGGWGLRLSASAGKAGSGAGAPIGGGLTNGPSGSTGGGAGGSYGGGGAGALTTGAVQTGGAGGNGLIRIWEFA